jgi:hypothetical protein
MSMANPRRQQEWAHQIAEHRRALDEFVAVAGAVGEAAWNAPRADGKWSPAQVAEHVRVTYLAVLGELGGGAGMRIRTSWLKQQVLRRVVMPWMLRTGRFPKGAPAVREIRPADGPYDQSTVLAGVRAEGERFLAALAGLDLDAFGGISHPFFGKMEPVGGLRLLTLHTRHHQAQLEDRAA